MSELIARLQAAMRETARAQYEAQPIPPFTAFFHPRDMLTFLNYAIPDAPASGDLAKPLAELRAAYQARNRRPRFEFIEEYAPDLPQTLRAAGFEEEARQQLMVCTAQTWRAAPETPGLEVLVLDAEAPAELIRQNLVTNDLGFNPASSGHFSAEDVERFRQMLGGGRMATALLYGQAVGAGMVNPPRDGLAELVGIATLEPFRRRGVATALTARLAQEAFALGVETAFLSAADERAGRVYERIGFRRVATMLAYIEPLVGGVAGAPAGGR
jgi:ribosomal protein S18 acetylase RimI-like enzyme